MTDSKPRGKRCVPPGSYICMDDFWENEVIKALLNQRAWVFQERSLYCGILHFGSSQLLWECMEIECCETFPAGTPAFFSMSSNCKKCVPLNITFSLGDTDLLEPWCKTVSDYSGGRLTCPEDKLVAISGLATFMHSKRPDHYIAGLWDSALPWRLFWMVGVSVLYEARLQPCYRAPSWSWASLDGPVDIRKGRQT